MPVARDTSACRIRLGIASDIRKLEWNGAFTTHRAIIEQAFAAQAAGEGLVLIADLDAFPVGQLWVRFAGACVPRFWALRVMPVHQGAGLGSRLLDYGEAELARRGFETWEIGAEKSNLAALRFYRSRGYAIAYEQIETYSYAAPSGEPREGRADQWICRKIGLPARDLTPRDWQARAAHTVADARNANVQAAPRPPACRNTPTAERGYSGRRNGRRSGQARDRADGRESRS